MKILVSVDQAAALRQGIDAPSSTTRIEVDPATLTEEQREILSVALCRGHDASRYITVVRPDLEGLIQALDEIKSQDPVEVDELGQDADYWASDGCGGAVIMPGADSAADAADDYVHEGEWGPVTVTVRHSVHVWQQSYAIVDGRIRLVYLDHGWHNVDVDPDEPGCTGDDHDWQSPEWLGGVKENPGVWGHGGGVVIREVCAHCGVYRRTDTWVQDSSGNRYQSVEYLPADDASQGWVAQSAA